MLKSKILILICTLLLISCGDKKKDKLNPVLDLKTQSQTGIDFINHLKNTPALNILNYLYYYNGAGVSVADFNNDGLADIYFGSNEGVDKLYINKGNLKFEDVTNYSGIDNSTGWTNGITSIDINNDGLLDLYICKVGLHNSIKGHNLLYVNKGVENGIPKFIEESKFYNLDISSYATQSAFFDYDLDGDLDMYLLNHSVYPNANYGKGNIRFQQDSLSGDRMLENVNGKFKDVSIDANIYQGKIGYGLGISVGDINNDGYPDLYIGNDFFENDYLYLNQGDKSFKEVISSGNNSLGHTSHYSMGNAISDINNDGNSDIISLDMLPEDLYNYKTSGLEFAYPIYNSYLLNGYQPQYMQNTLHVNSGNGQFMEVGHLSGLAATEWSWSPLSADLDNDGFKDLYITNGILGATNDMDFINFISNDQIQSQLGDSITAEQMKFIEKMPSKKIRNYIFKNIGDNIFADVSDQWALSKTSYSSGAAYADLDNDGDLDIVVNNVNEPAFLLENKSNSIFPKNRFLKVKFKGDSSNLYGIGAKIKIYKGRNILVEENFNSRGFMSSIEPQIHLGLGELSEIDSMVVIWPDSKFQVYKNLTVNQALEVNYLNANSNSLKKEVASTKDSGFHEFKGVDFVHSERTSIEFNRDPLVPFASTNEGPNISVADINLDGLEDFFISGAKAQPSSLFIQQTDGSFMKQQEDLFNLTSINEDISHSFADFNNDGWIDLIVTSGGNEFKEGKALEPRIYYNRNGQFEADTTSFSAIRINASKVLVSDINKDNYLDIIITADSEGLEFGKSPRQYIFINDSNGNFIDQTKIIAPDFYRIGNVKDAQLVDFDKDGDEDLILVGHWMPITLLINKDGKFNKKETPSLSKTHGWWNTVEIGDFDKDGDLDIIAGNWGLNSRLKASIEEPITLYSYDFDNNGKTEPLVSFFYKGEETPFASKDEIVKQLPYINKKYLSYSDFANADFSEIFRKDNLAKAKKKRVYELASCFFENQGNLVFNKVTLPVLAQASAIFSIAIIDFNKDGFDDLFLTGNNFEISTQLSRLDASHGELLFFDIDKGFINARNDKFPISGAVRDLARITINQSNYLIVARNNASPLFLKIESSNDEDK